MSRCLFDKVNVLSCPTKWLKLEETSTVVSRHTNGEGQKRLMRNFASVSMVFGILVSIITTCTYSGAIGIGAIGPAAAENPTGGFTLSKHCYLNLTLFIFVVTGVLQTCSAIVIHVHSNMENQEYPRVGWMLTSLLSALSLFTSYFAMNYFNYVHFKEAPLDPLILHAVIWADLLFLVVSIICSLISFQRLIDDEDRKNTLWNRGQESGVDEEILKL